MRRPRTPSPQPSHGPSRVLSARARHDRPVRGWTLPAVADKIRRGVAEGRGAPRRVARRGGGTVRGSAQCGRQSVRNVFVVELLKLFLERVDLE